MTRFNRLLVIGCALIILIFTGRLVPYALGFGMAIWSLVFDRCPIFRAGTESQNLGNLGNLRSAVMIFHDDAKRYPADPAELLIGGKYLSKISLSETCSHRRSDAIQLMSSPDFAAGRFADSGGWAYVTSGPSAGSVFVNCTHTDTRGSVWTSY